MVYKHAENSNFEDLSSGRVLIGAPGLTNFPVRLAAEIFGRCLDYTVSKEGLTVYDPCGGGAYMLAVLGFLFPDKIKAIVCSDCDGEALGFAERNLGLLTEAGLAGRIGELSRLHELYGKQSHLDAMRSARNMLKIIEARSFEPEITVFRANILAGGILSDAKFQADVVITDVPYDRLTSWNSGGDGGALPVNTMLDNILPVLARGAVAAVCSDKGQKITNEKYQRLERERVGKRKFEILTLDK